MMTMDDYWDSLNQAQIDLFNRNLLKAEETSIDVPINDAIDIWYLIDKDLRGSKPHVMYEGEREQEPPDASGYSEGCEPNCYDAGE